MEQKEQDRFISAILASIIAAVLWFVIPKIMWKLIWEPLFDTELLWGRYYIVTVIEDVFFFFTVVISIIIANQVGKKKAELGKVFLVSFVVVLVEIVLEKLMGLFLDMGLFSPIPYVAYLVRIAVLVGLGEFYILGISQKKSGNVLVSTPIVNQTTNIRNTEEKRDMFCRNCGNKMDSNAVVCVKCGVAKGSGNAYCPNCGGETNPNAAVCLNCGGSLANQNVVTGENAKSKLVAGLLGIFLGGLGIHNFYLGYTKKAVVQVLLGTVGISLLFVGPVVSGIWGLVEGIMILTGSIKVDGNGNPLKS